MTSVHPPPRWRAAAASEVITPRNPCCLGGYGGRGEAFKDIADPLEINALLLDDGDKQIVIASFDLLYIGAELRDAILARLTPARDPSSVLLAASHTHYAPMTQYGTPGLGAADPAYVDWVASRAAALMNSLPSRLQPVDASYHEGTAAHSVNRRLVRWRVRAGGLRRGCGMAPNPAAFRDETLRLLRFTAAGGICLAALWNYACHPTGYPEKLSVSAEFPGTVRGVLRGEAGQPLPVIFLQGFCGDVRPPFRARVRGVRSLGKRVCLGPQFAPPSVSEWREWAFSLAHRVCDAFDSAGVPITAGPLLAESHSVPLADFTGGPSARRCMTVQHVGIGDALSFLALEAEPVTHYRKLAETAFAGRKLITLGYIGEVFGYLPADDMIPQGGYEADGFRPHFNFDGRYRGNVEEAIERAFRTFSGAIRPGRESGGRGYGRCPEKS